MTNALLDRYRHIAIEGPIGVGKSSLASKLAAHLGADLLLELPEDNPFLERFYSDPKAHAFQTQMHFLYQRVQQMQALSQPAISSRGVVSDFMFAKDAIFARMNLSDDEYRIYAQAYAQSSAQVREPDLIIWLQAAPATLSRRILQRGIAMEQGIGSDYLQRLCDAYLQHFSSHTGAPVFAVVTDSFNPVDREEDFALLMQHLRAFDGSRGLLDVSGDQGQAHRGSLF